MKKLFTTVLLLFIGFFPICAGADVIDFESGFSESQYVGIVTTTTNIVSFYSRAYPPTNAYTNAQIAQVGSPQVAFPSAYGADTPIGTGVGSFFLTDQNPQAAAESYFIRFSSPVADISLDLYDFDNGSWKAVLTAFSDINWTTENIVGATTPISTQGDGSVVNLSVNNPSSVIYSASLTWIGEGTPSIDDETGIDNISFTTVPVPGALWLLGSGLIGIVGIRKKVRK